MKVKATVSFAGEICMAVNEVCDVPEGIAAPLLKCGYLISVETPEAPPEDKPAEKTMEAEADEKPKKGKKPKEAE